MDNETFKKILEEENNNIKKQAQTKQILNYEIQNIAYTKNVIDEQKKMKNSDKQGLNSLEKYANDWILFLTKNQNNIEINSDEDVNNISSVRNSLQKKIHKEIDMSKQTGNINELKKEIEKDSNEISKNISKKTINNEGINFAKIFRTTTSAVSTQMIIFNMGQVILLSWVFVKIIQFILKIVSQIKVGVAAAGTFLSQAGGVIGGAVVQAVPYIVIGLGIYAIYRLIVAIIRHRNTTDPKQLDYIKEASAQYQKEVQADQYSSAVQVQKINEYNNQIQALTYQQGGQEA